MAAGERGIRRVRSVLLGVAALALAVLGSTAPAWSQKAKDTVRFVYDQAPENVDPFFNNVRIGVIIGQHVWDTLVYRDPNTGAYRGRLGMAAGR
jgi:peptide/nickel transport system substrate-binding protein